MFFLVLIYFMKQMLKEISIRIKILITEGSNRYLLSEVSSKKRQVLN